ncbi:MAG: hypothetical protein LC795_15610 [Acidobacteria bacterium]|nr:hypothetical protein [Acidobacteriota bacterium]MCA1620702.1 hypothetical protein [Acidobacteriota bacterium]
MANPAELTVTDLAANGSVAQPAVNAIDTNGTVPADVGGAHERVMFEVVNTDDAALTVTIEAGTEAAGAGRSGLGDLAVALTAAGGGNAARVIGPLEPARFQQADGKLNVTFAAAAGAPACSVRCYRLPKAA